MRDNLLQQLIDDPDSEEIEVVSHSPYLYPNCLPSKLRNTETSFGILSLNAQSLLAKFDSFQVLLKVLKSQDMYFLVICIQESWISDDSKLPLVKLNGYKVFHVNATSSTHGGVIAYVDSDYQVTIKAQINNSNTWDGLFLELGNKNQKNKIVVGDIYRPPKDDNSITHIDTFVEELEIVLNDIENLNHEVFICGDFNIYLSNINWNQHCSYFYDTMGTHSCFPKTTFPTRVNICNGATLIDNIFCKLTPLTIDTFCGIFLDYISDHFPYFVYVENIFHKQNKYPKYAKKRVNSGAAIQTMIHDIEDSDLGAKLNPNPSFRS